MLFDILLAKVSPVVIFVVIMVFIFAMLDYSGYCTFEMLIKVFGL
jgi:hypothetical protein